MKALPIKDMDLSRISSPYGVRVHPISGVKSKHNGIDLAYVKGTPVYAVDDGVVQTSKMQSNGRGLGNYVVIKHTNYYSLYAHLDTRKVRTGQSVLAGEQIGTVGTTGDSTGYHLHFGVCTIYVASNVNMGAFYDPTQELKELIEEVVTKTTMLVNGAKIQVDRILKDGTNYVKLRDLEKFDPSIKVGYNKQERMPEVRTK